MADQHATSQDTLRKIANILGMPVKSFYNDTESHALWTSCECMRLWYRLKTDAGRDAALDALRKVLDDERA